MADDQPIIIKRIKKGGHAAHGGAWKVAYADFVTAMMAFFLLLWLLSSTSEEQKEGIAEYFAPTIGVKNEMGIGVQGGESPTEEGVQNNDLTPVGLVFGAPSVGEMHKDPSKISDEEAQDESKAFEAAAEELKKAIEEELKEYKDSIIVEMTPDGLRIQVVDQDKLSMFELGSAELLPHAKKILTLISRVLQELPNNVSVSGHTDGTPYRAGAGYSNWELSADRANSSRRFLIDSGVEKKRINKVVGYADRDHLDQDDPTSPRNRRISILLLKKSESPFSVPAPSDLLAPPKVEEEAPRILIRQQPAQENHEMEAPTKDETVAEPEQPLY